jgi:PAS domain S-box-containing protein
MNIAACFAAWGMRAMSICVMEDLLVLALQAAPAGEKALHDALETLPAAIYLTDVDGVVTYFNPACIDFTGRRPEVGRDRWCITWRLYTNAGDFLPHDQCPMAVAINTRRPIRGVSAVAERPDGTRVVFRPYPTPIFDAKGRFTGAVNLLEDITDEVRADDLLAQAKRCRRLADALTNSQAADTLRRMAGDYEAKSASLRTNATDS